MQTLLITGGSGFLGGNLAVAASSAWNTYATCHRFALDLPGVQAVPGFDVRDRRAVQRTVEQIRPRVLIHAAAVASFDLCGRRPQLALDVNAQGTENVATAARRFGCRLLYLSTDLVFAGRKAFYSEEDPADPICRYGRTKLEGERAVASAAADHCILRVALVYGRSVNRARCFTETLIERLRAGQRVPLFTDEYRTPVYVGNLCQLLLEFSGRDDLQGLYHVGGNQRLSRAEFGRKLARVFGLDGSLIEPLSIGDHPFADNRPKDCSLSNARAANALRTEILSVEEGLGQMQAASRGPRPGPP